MSEEQNEVYNIVTTLMDRKENKFLKWALAFLFMTLAAIATAAFTLGIKIQGGINKIDFVVSSQASDQSETATRVSEWTAWRQDVNGKIDARLQDRYTATDYRWTSILFNMNNPPVRLPEWDTVKRAQP